MKVKFSHALETRRNLALSEEFFTSSPHIKWLREDIEALKLLNDGLDKLNLRDSCANLVVVGVGGSSLGAKAMLSFLKVKPKVVFIDSIDSAGFEKATKISQLGETQYLFISKGGSTGEVLSLFKLISDHLVEVGADLSQKICILTSPKPNNLLHEEAKKHDLKVLKFPADVSGRFSIFRDPGLIPILYEMKDISVIRESYKQVLGEMSEVYQIIDFLINSIERSDVAQNFWCYDKKLYSFRAWLRQLISESLGKKSPTQKSYLLPPFVECDGSKDQHSYLQHILSNPKKNCNIIFRFEVDPDEATNLIQAQRAESDKLLRYFDKYKIPYCLIELKENSFEDISKLFITWMFVVQAIGNFYALDVYGQDHIDELKRLLV